MGVRPDKAKEMKVDFYYPTNLDWIYRFSSPRRNPRLNYICHKTPYYDSKCCIVKITDTETNVVSIGRVSIPISSFEVYSEFVMLCKALKNCNSIDDWQAKQLIDFIQPEIDCLVKEIDNWDSSTRYNWKNYLEKFRTEFEFYLPFMKKRGVDIDEYLQLLESKI